jgi:aminoglycoside/choline kinase family phosphotransferase
LVDFQGAVVGPAPYDLVNLLDDARRIVPDDIRVRVPGNRFIEHLMPAEKEAFLAWYPVLACQFHCRVIGQAVKLAVHSGKTRLLDLVPYSFPSFAARLEAPAIGPAGPVVCSRKGLISEKRRPLICLAWAP